jgi:glycosyltransferase involved in cell wall biosynthesis
MLASSGPVPIAFCITDLDRGGAERAMSQLVLGLSRQQWQPRIYCLGPRGHFANVIEAAEIDVECFDARGLMSLPRVMIQLTRALSRFRPALLQTFLFHANLLGRFAGRLAGVPCIVSGIRVAERRSRWYGRLDRWTNALVDQNVCVSQGVADFSISETKLLPNKLTVIPNGVDFEQLANATPADLASLGIPPGGRVIITVGRLEEQKGIDHLLRAASLVVRDHDCHILIAGEGRDRSQLEATAQHLGVSNSVHFIGHRADVPNLLAAADVFVLPSLWEGMSNALLEAMAVGVPVIATAVEGSKELIRPNETGLLVSTANSDELAEAIRRTLAMPVQSAEMALRAQVLVREWYSVTRMISAYDELYRRLLSGP